MILSHLLPNSWYNWYVVRYSILLHESRSDSVQLELLQPLKGGLGQKDLVTAQLLVVHQLLLSRSETQQSNSEPQKANGAHIRFDSVIIETEVPFLASSLVLQFLAMPLCPGNQTSLIIQKLAARDSWWDRYALRLLWRLLYTLLTSRKYKTVLGADIWTTRI